MEIFPPNVFFESKITMSKNKNGSLGLRLDLVAVDNTLDELIDLRGIADDYPEIVEVRDIIHNIRVSSKLGATKAFDEINTANQFAVAIDTGDKISVWGTSSDSFDLELAFGIICRAKEKVNKDMLYKLFLRVMDGDFDD